MTSPAREDPRRPAMSRRVAAAGVGVLLLAAAITWSRLGSDARVAAQPVPGVPLEGSSELRLLVASDPAPVVLDVDTEPSRRSPAFPQATAARSMWRRWAMMP